MGSKKSAEQGTYPPPELQKGHFLGFGPVLTHILGPGRNFGVRNDPKTAPDPNLGVRIEKIGPPGPFFSIFDPPEPKNSSLELKNGFRGSKIEKIDPGRRFFDNLTPRGVIFSNFTLPNWFF